MKFKKNMSLRGGAQRRRGNLLSIFALIIVLFAGFTIWSNFNRPVSADWYNTLWQYRQKITIDKTKVGGGAENETNFPVLVSITEPKLIKGAQASGNDIMFTDSDGITKLSHEIESYNSSTGQLIAWVKVPTLSYTTNSVLYMYYGSASAPSQQNATDVWSNGFAAVYHLKETGTNPTVNDSTSNANNSTTNLSDPTTSGRIDGATAFTSANSDYIEIADSASLSPTSALTVSGWFYHQMIGAEQQAFISKWDYSTQGSWSIDAQPITHTNDLHFRAPTSLVDDGGTDGYVDITALTPNTWHYITMTFDGSGSGNSGRLKAYIDGANQTLTFRGTIPASIPDSTATLKLGRFGGTLTRYFNGSVDDVKISSTARSSGWISTEYNNQNSPSTFLTLSSTQEKTKAPVLNWKFDEGLGTTVNSPAGTINWYNSSWSYRKKLTIDHTKVGGTTENEANFPVLVSLTGLSNINTNGTDIRFTSSDGVTELPREIESYSGGTLVAWVKVPTLSYTTDTVLYMYYGNSSATEPSASSTYGSQNVWDSNFKGVWHLGDTSSPALDSTSNAKNMTANGSPTFTTSAMVGKGVTLISVSNSYLTNASFATTTDKTFSLWINANSLVAGYNTLIEGGSNDNPWFGINVNKVHLFNTSQSSSSSISTGTWYYLTYTSDNSSNKGKIYINGVQDGADGTAATQISSGLGLGRRSGDNVFNGIIDETRVSSTARSAGWIATEYNNQNSPSTFMTTGSQEAFSWQQSDQCVSGKCIYFNGTSISPSANIQNVQSIGFWIKPTTTTQSVLDLDGGTHTITISSGTISANGFASPAIYVNGRSTTAVGANQWNHVEITTGTTFTATTGMTLGKVSSTYFSGYIDEFKIYDYQRTAAEVKSDYNSASVSVGSVNNPPNPLSNGLVGYWKMDESSWNGTSGEVIDSSGNNNNGTAAGSATTGAGKFGNGGSFSGGRFTIPSMSLGSTHTVSFWTNSNTPSAVIMANGSTIDQVDILSGNIYEQSYLHTYVNVPTGSITIGTWNHWVITRNGTVVSFYRNGQLLSTPQTLGSSGGSMSVDTIGSYADGTYSFSGSMDELRIYNRALSASEVSQLYNYAPGPIAQYNFEEGSGTTVKDSGGAQNDGTWNGTGNHWTTGKIGKAGNFNGSNDWVTITDTGLPSSSGARTISMWIKPNSVSVDWAGFLGYGTESSNQMLLFATCDGASANKLIIGKYNTNASACSTGSIITGVWQYIAATIDASGNVTYYINGSSAGTATLAGINTVLGSGYIGKAYATGAKFNGQIDQVKVYNYARTQAQIIADMGTSMTQTRPQINKNPVGYWKFDEGSGSAANDSSGNHNNGTITGATWNNDGKFGRALQFNGSSNYVLTNATVAGSDSYTFSSWINITGGQGNQRWFISHYLDSSSNGYSFGLNTSNNLVLTQHGVTIATGSTALLANNWYFVSGVISGNSANIYLNGKLDGSGTFTGLTDETVKFIIGSLDQNRFYFNGLIDEVKIYNYALTSDEIKIEFNRGFSLQLGGTGIASQSASAAYCIPGDTSPCSAPVAEYNFEEGSGTTVKDSGGAQNDGTWSGTGNHWTTGKIGKAGNFNGSNDYVSGSVLPAMSSFTISAWIKPNGNQVGTPAVVTDIYAAGPQILNYALAFQSGGLAISGGYYRNGWQLTPTATLASGQWSYVVFTFDGTTEKLYVNNGTALTNTPTYTPLSGNSGFRIGRRWDTSDYFNGQIDQVKIYNYARTAAQVAWDYNNGKPVGWWRMDECTGTSIKDSSENKNTGTLTNATAGDCNTNASTAWYNGRTGKFGASLKFDGSDDYVNIPTTNNIDAAGKSQYSLSLWMYLTGYDNLSGGYTPFGEVTQSSKDYNRFNLYRSSSTSCGTNVFSFDTRDTSTGDTGTREQLCGFAPNLNQWYHVVLVYDAVNNFKGIYSNGILVSSTSNSVNSFTSTPSTLISIGGTPSNAFFNGQIDDVRIYNYALTTSQIKTLYNQNFGVKF